MISAIRKQPNSFTVRCINILVIVLGLAISQSAMALKTDRDQPADIESDDTVFDFKTGKRTFNGNVIVVQGTLRIKADKMVANYKSGELQNATAWGDLARFKQRPDGKPNDVEGRARKIYVDSVANTLTLVGRASLKQGADTANGETIIYNMANDTLQVKGGAKFGSGGNTGKARPQRKLEDPFKDDPVPTKPAVTNKPTTNAKQTAKDTVDTAIETDDNTQQETVAEPEYAPTKSGRSRLIIQPKKKKPTTAESDED